MGRLGLQGPQTNADPESLGRSRIQGLRSFRGGEAANMALFPGEAGGREEIGMEHRPLSDDAGWAELEALAEAADAVAREEARHLSATTPDPRASVPTALRSADLHDLLRVGRSTLHDALRRGDIPAPTLRIGAQGRLLWGRGVIQRWMDRSDRPAAVDGRLVLTLEAEPVKSPETLPLTCVVSFTSFADLRHPDQVFVFARGGPLPGNRSSVPHPGRGRTPPPTLLPPPGCGAGLRQPGGGQGGHHRSAWSQDRSVNPYLLR